MPRVYDDERTQATEGEHDDLGVHSERREAEVDSLNKAFDAPAIDDSERNTGKTTESDKSDAEED